MSDFIRRGFEGLFSPTTGKYVGVVDINGKEQILGAGSADLGGQIVITEAPAGTLTASTTGGFQILTGKWQRADTLGGARTDIPGATSLSYVKTVSDDNKYLSFVALTIAVNSGQVLSTVANFGAAGSAFGPTAIGGLIE